MEESKKRAGDSAKHGSPKKQRVSKKGSKPKSKKKDNNKPKRPMSAYFCYLEFFRHDLKQRKSNGEEVPSKIGDVAKMAGSRWKSMSDEDKKPFVERSLREKKFYAEQVKSTKPARDENKPKKPRTAFFYFLDEFREKMKGDVNVDGKQIPSLAGDKWRNMDDNDKKKYVNLHCVAKKIYEEQMKDYNAKYPEKPQEKAQKKSKPKAKEVSESEEDEEEEDEEEENDEEDEEEDEEDEDSD